MTPNPTPEHLRLAPRGILPNSVRVFAPEWLELSEDDKAELLAHTEFLNRLSDQVLYGVYFNPDFKEERSLHGIKYLFKDGGSS